METCLCECDICRGSLYVPSEDRTECECLPVANCTEYMNGHPTDNDDWENSSGNPNEDGAGYCSCQGCKGGYELVKGGEQNVCCKKIDNCSEYNTDCGCTKCVDGYEPEDGACKKEEDCLCYHGPNDLGCLVCENDEGYCNELKEEGYEPGDPWCPGTCVDGGLWCECEIEDCYLATANQDTKKCQCECKTEEECL